MKKLDENQKKFLGTVPKKYQLVETFWDCPEISKTSNKGITLIALIITIIVMLIIVGVTINVALNGGIFEKTKDATFKTKISQIQEALLVKKAELVAGNNGKEPPYNLTINDLDISNELKNEYGSKLKIGADGKLYFDPELVTNAEEQTKLKAEGIEEYKGEPAEKTYTFKVGDLLARANDNTITLDDLKELCHDENLEISTYLTDLDDITLCYTSSDNSVLCSIETWIDRIKNSTLNRNKCNVFCYRKWWAIVRMPVYHI